LFVPDRCNGRETFSEKEAALQIIFRPLYEMENITGNVVRLVTVTGGGGGSLVPPSSAAWQTTNHMGGSAVTDLVSSLAYKGSAYDDNSGKSPNRKALSH
jgi:hypothetical protein